VHAFAVDMSAVCFESVAQLIKIINLITNTPNYTRSPLLTAFIQSHRMTNTTLPDTTGGVANKSITCYSSGRWCTAPRARIHRHHRPIHVASVTAPCEQRRQHSR
jgi:hypothetical protein